MVANPVSSFDIHSTFSMFKSVKKERHDEADNRIGKHHCCKRRSWSWALPHTSIRGVRAAASCRWAVRHNNRHIPAKCRLQTASNQLNREPDTHCASGSIPSHYLILCLRRGNSFHYTNGNGSWSHFHSMFWYHLNAGNTYIVTSKKLWIKYLMFVMIIVNAVALHKRWVPQCLGASVSFTSWWGAALLGWLVACNIVLKRTW